MKLMIWTMTYEGEITKELPAKHPHLIRAEMRRAMRQNPKAEMVWAVNEEGDPLIMLNPDDFCIENHPDAEVIKSLYTEQPPAKSGCSYQENKV